MGITDLSCKVPYWWIKDEAYTNYLNILMDKRIITNVSDYWIYDVFYLIVFFSYIDFK